MSQPPLKLVLHTNVVVDFLHMREPNYEHVRKLMIFGYAHELELWITSAQMTDLIFILTDGGDPSLVPEVKHQLRELRKFINVFPVGEDEVDIALLSTWDNIEDFMLFQCALSLKADAIITRNVSDFEERVVKVLTCKEFM